MAFWRPDTAFYPAARMAMQAARENLGQVETFDPEAWRQQPSDRRPFRTTSFSRAAGCITVCTPKGFLREQWSPLSANRLLSIRDNRLPAGRL
jgi:hypothetical protein